LNQNKKHIGAIGVLRKSLLSLKAIKKKKIIEVSKMPTCDFKVKSREFKMEIKIFL
jgi:hypothetical protein